MTASKHKDKKVSIKKAGIASFPAFILSVFVCGFVGRSRLAGTFRPKLDNDYALTHRTMQALLNKKVIQYEYFYPQSQFYLCYLVV
jgi:hypothetical protein